VGVASFVEFTRLHGITAVLPASPATLCLWLTSLAWPPRSLQFGTCKVYLAAVVTHHFECGFDSPLRGAPPMSDRVLAGIKRLTAPTAARPKLPITTAMLRSKQPHLQLRTYSDSLLWAVFWVATTGLLRISEFIYHHSMPDRLLRRAQLTAFDVSGRPLDLSSLRTLNGPHVINRLSLHLEASKTAPLRVGGDIVLASRTTIEAVCAYLLLRVEPGQPSSTMAASCPLFALADATPITRVWLMDRLNHLLQLCGLDASRYSSHSFRKGGAVSLQALGVQDSLVRQQGRWKSDAFHLYLRHPSLDALIAATANL
jgi:hypothetical protein